MRRGGERRKKKAVKSTRDGGIRERLHRGVLSWQPSGQAVEEDTTCPDSRNCGRHRPRGLSRAVAAPAHAAVVQLPCWQAAESPSSQPGPLTSLPWSTFKRENPVISYEVRDTAWPHSEMRWSSSLCVLHHWARACSRHWRRAPAHFSRPAVSSHSSLAQEGLARSSVWSPGPHRHSSQGTSPARAALWMA